MHAKQVIDTGLDETSCFFADGDGLEVPHGYYYEKQSEDAFYQYTSAGEALAYTSEGVLRPFYPSIFEGGDFSFDSSRRKVSTADSFSFGPVVLFVMGEVWTPDASKEAAGQRPRGHVRAGIRNRHGSRALRKVSCVAVVLFVACSGCLTPQARLSGNRQSFPHV